MQGGQVGRTQALPREDRRGVGGPSAGQTKGGEECDTCHTPPRGRVISQITCSLTISPLSLSWRCTASPAAFKLFFFFATVRNRFEVEQHTIHVTNKYV